MKKHNFYNAKIAFILLSVLSMNACKVDTFEELEGVEQKVSLVQVTSGELQLKTDNIIVDKPNKLIRRAMGLVLSGLAANTGFDADIELDFNKVPDGYDKLKPSECYLSASASSNEPINKVSIPAGSQRAPFYLNITKDAIDAHGGKPVAISVNILKTSKYSLNPKGQTAYILVNTSEFGTLKTNVTETYFKNPVFAREAGTTARFVNVGEWITNASMKNSRPTGAGYDQNVGYLGIERWSGGDSPIIDGKIYQTFNLPAGNYAIEVDMRKVAADEHSYFVVSAGETIPDAAQIGSALVQKGITNDFNNKLLSVEFKLDAPKQVAIGFLININQGTQKIIQARNIKMYKVENLFDE